MHVIFVEEAILSFNTGGAVTVMDDEDEHPLASFTVTEYVPAERLVTVELVLTTGLQLYVYGAVPPVTTAFSNKLSRVPKHDALTRVLEGMVTLIPAPPVTFTRTESVDEQPLVSVTCTA